MSGKPINLIKTKWPKYFGTPCIHRDSRENISFILHSLHCNVLTIEMFSFEQIQDKYTQSTIRMFGC